MKNILLTLCFVMAGASDKPGKHDFEILKRLVLPDGAVMRAKYPGRPCRDCLFVDPVMDRKSLMKIWNLNKLCGVLGVFNCQGAGAWPGLENSVQLDSLELTGEITPADIEYLNEITLQPWTGDFAVFSFKSGSLSRVSLHGKLRVNLKPLQCDVFTVSPIKSYNQDIQFAPIGLTNMYNSGGAVDAVEGVDDSSCNKIQIRGRGEGILGAYMNLEPKFCYVNMEEVQFKFSSEQHFLTVTVPTGTNFWEIDIHY